MTYISFSSKDSKKPGAQKDSSFCISELGFNLNRDYRTRFPNFELQTEATPINTRSGWIYSLVTSLDNSHTRDESGIDDDGKRGKHVRGIRRCTGERSRIASLDRTTGDAQASIGNPMRNIPCDSTWSALAWAFVQARTSRS